MLIDEIIRAVKAAGSHFFCVDNMRAFNSRVYPQVYTGANGIYFITSERLQIPYISPVSRLYTVRKFNPADSSIATIGEFNTLTRKQAIALAKKSAKG